MDAMYIFLLIGNIIFMYMNYRDEEWFLFLLNCLGAICCVVKLIG